MKWVGLQARPLASRHEAAATRSPTQWVRHEMAFGAAQMSVLVQVRPP
jgi:hypothetical protein